MSRSSLENLETRPNLTNLQVPNGQSSYKTDPNNGSFTNTNNERIKRNSKALLNYYESVTPQKCNQFWNVYKEFCTILDIPREFDYRKQYKLYKAFVLEIHSAASNHTKIHTNSDSEDSIVISTLNNPINVMSQDSDNSTNSILETKEDEAYDDIDFNEIKKLDQVERLEQLFNEIELTRAYQYWNAYKAMCEILDIDRQYRYLKDYQDYKASVNRMRQRFKTNYDNKGGDDYKKSIKLAKIRTSKQFNKMLETIYNKLKSRQTVTIDLENVKDRQTKLTELLEIIDSSFPTLIYSSNNAFKMESVSETPSGSQQTKTAILTPDRMQRYLRTLSSSIDLISMDQENISSDEEFLSNLRKIRFIRFELVNWQGKTKRKGGAYCPFTHKFKLGDKYANLTPLDIYTKEQLQRKKFRDACIVTALKRQIKKLDKEQSDMRLNRLRLIINEKAVGKRRLTAISNELECQIKLNYLSKTGIIRTKTYGNKESELIYRVGLIMGHYIDNSKRYNICNVALTKYDQIKHLPRWWLINGFIDNRPHRVNKSSITAFTLIRWLVKRGDEFLEKIRPGQISVNYEINEKLGPTTLDYEIEKNVRPFVRKRGWKDQNECNLLKIKEKNILSDQLVKRFDKDEDHNKYSYEITNTKRLELIVKDKDKRDKYFEKIGEIRHKPFKSEKDRLEFVKSHTTILRKTIKNSRNNITRTERKPSKAIYNGRLFTGGIGIQSFCREERNLLCEGNYIDIDIKNSHPNFYKIICIDKGYDHEQLDRYIEHREEVLAEVMVALDCKRPRAKQIILELLNGQNLYKRWEKVPFLKLFKEETAENVERWASEPEHQDILKIHLEQYKEAHKSDDKDRPLVSFLNKMFNLMEAEALRMAIEVVKSEKLAIHNYDTIVNMHDGFMICNPSATQDQIDNVISLINDKVQNRFGSDIEFCQKPIESELDWCDFLSDEELNKTEMQIATDYDIKKHWIDMSYKVSAIDFETTTDGSSHKEFMVSFYDGDVHSVFYGRDCGKQMLESLTHKFYVMYAHNLSYDINPLIKHLDITDKTIYFNNRFMKSVCLYTQRSGRVIKIAFKDSNCIVQGKLATYPGMFHLKDKDGNPIKKEVFPYGLYNSKNIDKGLKLIKDRQTGKLREGLKLKISDGLLYLKEKDHNEFISNIKSFGCEISDKFFDAKKYAEIYCKLDTYICYEGMRVFRDSVLELSKGVIDIDHFPSISSISQAYMTQNNVFDDVNEISGVPAQFIRETIVGGRVCTADNKMFCLRNGWLYSKDGPGKPEKRIAPMPEGMEDEDMNSMYPYGMREMKGFLKGIPKVIDKGDLTKKWLDENVDHYYVDVKITKVGKHRSIPTIPVKVDGKVIYDDRLYTGRIFHLDKIQLEDAIEFNKIEFEIVKGYYFDQGYNTNIKGVIEELYNKRLKFKKEDNPIQNSYKLIMNTAYGKTIMREQKHGYIFKNSKAEMLKDLIYNNLNRVESTEIAPGKYMTKTKEDILDHYNMPHVGSMILSQSKRAMNRIMYLAEDLGIIITYSDTDSMHIDKSKLGLLGREFRKKYGFALFGKKLGQLTSDFNPHKKCKNKDMRKYEGGHLVCETCGFVEGHTKAVESYILTKKVYIDKIEYVTEGNKLAYQYHTRMKGICSHSINNKGDELIEDYKKYLDTDNYNNEMVVFQRLYQADELEFDLVDKNSIKIMKMKDLSYKSRTKFIRNLKINETRDMIDNLITSEI